jgi:hypothetical protein
VYLTIVKNTSTGEYTTNMTFRDVVQTITSFKISGSYLSIDYQKDGGDLGSASTPVDTSTATDSDNLITSRAVRNYIAEYMTANYDNGDTEEF